MSDILKDILLDPKFQEGSAWQRHKYKEGDTIIHKNEIGQSLYYIDSGIVRILGDVQFDMGKHIRPGFCDLKVGDIFGEICLYTPLLQTETVNALTECCILAIDGQRLNVFLDDHPIQGYLFFKELFKIIHQRLIRANSRIENLLAWGLKVHNIDKHLS